jgi:hypothetical protein
MKLMRVVSSLIALVVLCHHTPSQAALHNRMDVHADWNLPAVIYPETWPDPLRFSIDNSAAHLVALIPDSGNNATSRQIVVSARAGEAWQAPVVIATNGAYSTDLYQYLPQQSHPVISGDGSTIAYVGYTGSTHAAFVVNRVAGETWSAPAMVPAGLPNTHYWISLSQDGNTLALCDYPFFGTQQVYVISRQNGVWNSPAGVSAGGYPSLSADGRKLAFVRNGQVAFSERQDGAWTSPVTLTNNDANAFIVEYPQMSADGRAIFYWLVKLVPDGNALIRAAQDLYLIRRTGRQWGESQKITPAPLLPASVTDGPAAADRYATRLIYTHAVTATDPINGQTYVYASQLEVSEGITDTWKTTHLVEANGFGNTNKWPRLTPDGRTLVFDGGTRYGSASPINNALWQMTTQTAPPQPPWAFNISALINMGGGSLFSPFDNMGYLFGAGTFSDTVEFTHGLPPMPLPPPPAGQFGIGGIGGIGGLGGLFSANALGPDGLSLQPLTPFTVTVNYTGTPTGPTIPGSLNVWWLNMGQWTPLPSQDDPTTRVLTATVNHLSEFAVFGRTNSLYLPAVLRK